VSSPATPKDEMPAFLAATDACLVHLTRTELFKTCCRRRSSRPRRCGSRSSSAWRVSRRSWSRGRAGICIQPENEDDLIAAVEKLAADPELAAASARRATSGSRAAIPTIGSRTTTPRCSSGCARAEGPAVKIVNVVGARPNLMKIAPLMDAYASAPEIEPLLVHTGQHYDANLSELFFRQLGIPSPT
jgi:hypothetical protein